MLCAGLELQRRILKYFPFGQMAAQAFSGPKIQKGSQTMMWSHEVTREFNSIHNITQIKQKEKGGGGGDETKVTIGLNLVQCNK